MKFIFLLSLSYSFICFGSEVKLVKNGNSKASLIGVSCANLRENRDSLCEWKESLGESIKLESQSCRRISNSKYSLDVTTCLPKLTLSTHRKKNYKDGPNCWGTALSLKGYTSKPKFVWPEEIRYWLNSPVCRKLKPNEELRPGDLISSFGPEYIHDTSEEKDAGGKFWDVLFPSRYLSHGGNQGYSGYHWNLHTETYISPELSFGKDSPNKLDLFRFHSFNEMYGRSRDNNSECQELQSKTPHYREYNNEPVSVRSSQCGYFSLAYRCSSLKSISQDNKSRLDLFKIKEELKSLEAINSILYQSIFTSNNIGTKIKDEYLALAAVMAQEAESSLRALPQSTYSMNEMLLVKKYFSAHAIIKFFEFQ